MIRVGLLGARGRMGQWVARLLSTEFSSKARLEAQPVRGESLATLLGVDVVIDFSLPEAFTELAREALASNSALPAFVVGSTGWKAEQRAVVEELAQRTPVLMSSNFSTGVLALQQILKNATPMLGKLGYTPVLVDTHHRHKKDAPSGTALLLTRTMETAGATAPIQTQSVRAGEIVGDHEITFYGPGDHIVLGHFAQDRSIFARGAIDAAIWLHESRPTLRLGEVLSMERFFAEKTR